MNFFTRLALLFGFKKFENFVQQQPGLPDDTLQVAATLDAHTTRIGLTMAVTSLLASSDNLLRGTETVNMFLGHFFVILGGVGLVFARHAASANTIQINAALQSAREKLNLPSVIKSLVFALGVGFAVFLIAPCSRADTNSILGQGASQIASNAETTAPAPANAKIALPKLTLVEKLPQITNGWALLSAVFEVTTVDGVYSAATDGERGPGVATLAAILPIETPDDGMRLLIGPAMVTMAAPDATRVLGELGITSKIINGAIVQSTVLKIPVLGDVIKVTRLDFSGFYFYFGGGLLLNSELNHLDRGLGFSAGAGGISFGQGDN